MLIYRIEDAEGKGAFRGLVHDAMDAAAETLGFTDFYETDEPDPRRHPNLYDDGGFDPKFIETFDETPRGTSPYYFGFRSIESLITWFDSEIIRREMKKLGGKVVLYQSDDFHAGNTQVVFRISTAQKIEEISIPTLN